MRLAFWKKPPATAELTEEQMQVRFSRAVQEILEITARDMADGRDWVGRVDISDLHHSTPREQVVCIIEKRIEDARLSGNPDPRG